MRDTWPRTSQPHSAGWDYTLGRTIGRLSSDVDHLKDDVQDIREKREKDKSELDKIKTWGERIALLVVLYAATAGMHASAPMVGPVVGAMARSVMSGLRGP